MSLRRPSLAGGVLLALALAIPALSIAPVGAASSDIVGTASTFGVLGGSTVTNTGSTVVAGDVGVWPGTAITGFPPGISDEPRHANDAVAQQAQSDATTAYNDLDGRTSTATIPAGTIGTQTLSPGVYTADSTLLITGTLTLDADGDPNALFIFQVGSALTTATDSVVALINGASACNVFWQIGSSATLGTDSEFVGTIVALTSITANTRAEVEGQLLARNGAVTLDTNTIDTPVCAASQDNGGSTTTTSSTSTSTTSTTAAVTTTTSAPVTTTTVVAGGTTTGTTRGGPPMANTGLGLAPAVAAVVLLVVGALLLWVGRPTLNHAAARRYFP